ncbi:hypothetical protein KFU94_09860 [Chloroflexi bacterium TSY]|nr:hypothetical protein [Chloroflexi bacterium TSY]
MHSAYYTYYRHWHKQRNRIGSILGEDDTSWISSQWALAPMAKPVRPLSRQPRNRLLTASIFPMPVEQASSGTC